MSNNIFEILDKKIYMPYSAAFMQNKSISSAGNLVISEMKIFISVLVIMGIVPLPGITLYWPENNRYAHGYVMNAIQHDRFLATVYISLTVPYVELRSP